MRMIRFGLVLVGVTWGTACGALPDYAGPQPKPADSETATAVLAGGCFWGVDAVYKHVQGVSNVVSGGVPGIPDSIFLPENFVNPVLDYN